MRIVVSSTYRRRIVERLFSLTSHPLSVTDLAEITGFMPAGLYPVLAALEREKRITSHWNWASRLTPRQRLYTAVTTTGQ